MSTSSIFSIVIQTIAAISLIVSGIYVIWFKKSEQSKINHLVIGIWEILLGLVILVLYVILPIIY